MADVTITPGNVLADSAAIVERGVAGGTLTAGMTLYKDAAAADVLKGADANLSSAAAAVAGIALHGAAAGQPIAYVTQGDLTLGSVLTAGGVYVASATAGGIAPVADLVAGWRTSVLGIATSATVLRVRINNSDTAVPS